MFKLILSGELDGLPKQAFYLMVIRPFTCIKSYDSLNHLNKSHDF